MPEKNNSEEQTETQVNTTQIENSNETLEATLESTNSSAESITGNVVIEADGKPINNLIVIIAVIVIVLLILFGAIMRKKMKNGAPQEPNPSDKTAKQNNFSPKDNQKLAQDLKLTQSRLDQANQELNQLKGRLKNEEKIREIENRINAEKDELRRLRQG